MTQSVLAKLDNGEMAIGHYAGIKSKIGSFLIENVRTESGARADYQWVSAIEKCECDGEFVCNRCWKFNEIVTA